MADLETESADSTSVKGGNANIPDDVEESKKDEELLLAAAEEINAAAATTQEEVEIEDKSLS